MLKALVSREIRRWQHSLKRVVAGRGGPDSVHQLRVITRRCREGFRLLGYKSAALARFSHSLGPARDVEMLCQRLSSDLHRSPARRRLLKFFDQRRRATRRKLTRQLRSAATQRIGDSLQKQLRKLSLADAEEGALVRGGLRKAYKRLRRLWQKRPKRPASVYLHALRRAIRRLRYMCELSAPIGGKRLEHLAKQAIRWQQLLGNYQDALIAQRLLEPMRQHEARLLIKDFRRMEKNTSARFWQKWRKRGWRKLKHKTKKALVYL